MGGPVAGAATFLGLTTLDLIYLVERPPSENQKIVADRQEVAAGGPAANAAVTFAHLGGRARLVTGVGSSLFGEAARGDLAARKALLRFVDVAICSNDFRPPGCASARDTLAAMDQVGFVAITDGPEPVVYRWGARAGRLEVPRVPVVDSLGAGDVLHGAFCRYYPGLEDPVAALRSAIAVATRSCSSFGTRAWMDADVDAGHGPLSR